MTKFSKMNCYFQFRPDMVTDSQRDDRTDAVSSQTQTEETTATNSQLLITWIRTLTPQLPSLPSSSSDPPSDSLHAPPLPTLPFELVTEILCRLPVKFLLQLKCVCKSWNSLISDPKFAKKHLRVSSTRHHVVSSYLNPSSEFTLTAYPLSSIFTAAPQQLEYPLNEGNRIDLLVGSCDGILCFEIDQNSALLFNPSIRKFKKLPDMNNPRKEGSYTEYSFGYDHVNDDYKVVAVFCYECDDGAIGVYKTLVNVYSLSTNCWRRIQEFPSAAPLDEPGKFVSGRINWLPSASSSSSSKIIVSLDLGNECYEEILQPDYDNSAEMVGLTLGVLRHCLCIIYRSLYYSDIWVMREYGNKDSWTKLCVLPYIGDLFSWTYVLYAYEDGQVLLESQSGFVVYDYRYGTSNTLMIHNTSIWKTSEVYMESLVSPCF